MSAIVHAICVHAICERAICGTSPNQFLSYIGENNGRSLNFLSILYDTLSYGVCARAKTEISYLYGDVWNPLIFASVLRRETSICKIFYRFNKGRHFGCLTRILKQKSSKNLVQQIKKHHLKVKFNIHWRTFSWNWWIWCGIYSETAFLDISSRYFQCDQGLVNNYCAFIDPANDILAQHGSKVHRRHWWVEMLNGIFTFTCNSRIHSVFLMWPKVESQREVYLLFKAPTNYMRRTLFSLGTLLPDRRLVLWS